MARKPQQNVSAKASHEWVKTIALPIVLALIAAAGAWWTTERTYAAKLLEIEQQRDKDRRELSEIRSKAYSEARRADELKRVLEEASKQYVVLIDGVVADLSRELERREGPSQLVPIARRLVSARNSFRRDVDELRGQLNSTFDALEGLLGSSDPDPSRIDPIRQTLIRLKNEWPVKKVAIENGVKKLIAVR